MTWKHKLVILVVVLAIFSDMVAAMVGLFVLDDDPAPTWWLIWLLVSFVIAMASWVVMEMLPEPEED